MHSLCFENATRAFPPFSRTGKLMNSELVALIAVGIGIVAGLRSLTAPAVVAWAAQLGWIHLQGSPVAFMGSKWAVGIFTLLAVGELIADQLPGTPARTAAVGLSARILTGGLSGACLAAAGWRRPCRRRSRRGGRRSCRRLRRLPGPRGTGSCIGSPGFRDCHSRGYRCYRARSVFGLSLLKSHPQ